MSIADIPDNVNFLSPTGFRLIFQDLPSTEFFCQSANIPGLSLSEVQVSTPVNPIFQIGDILNYEDLSVRIIADEYMTNFKEIYDWVVGITAPQNSEQYRSRIVSKFAKTQVSLIILTGAQTPSIKFDFVNTFPISLSGLQFDIGGAGGEYLTFDVTFKYDSYNFSSLLNN